MPSPLFVATFDKLQIDRRVPPAEPATPGVRRAPTEEPATPRANRVSPVPTSYRHRRPLPLDLAAR